MTKSEPFLDDLIKLVNHNFTSLTPVHPFANLLILSEPLNLLKRAPDQKVLKCTTKVKRRPNKLNRHPITHTHRIQAVRHRVLCR